MAAQVIPQLTPEEYLKFERASDERHEFFRGEMWAMSGASLAHVRITSRFILELGVALKNGPCEVLGPDARLRVALDGLYAYPDIMAFCGKVELAEGSLDMLLNPTLIIEVLSPSTEAHDRGLKAAQYRTLASLGEYAFASQSEARVEVYRRQHSGQWLMTEFVGKDAICEFSSVGCRVALADIYRELAT